MDSLLDDIIAARRARLEIRKAEVPLDRIRETAARRMELASERRDFAAALTRPGLSVIAELKQASPSRGRLCSDYRPRQIAPAYETAGAAALSVLTEEQFFLGSLGDLQEAREATRLPVLRKDFILEPYQVYESAAAGADALLLIVAALSGARPQRLLWASTGTKDPTASDVLYVKALAAPFTVNTIPDKTLLAFADHGSVGELMADDGGDAEEVIAKFAKAGIDYDKLAADLQREAAESFVKDWNEMLTSIASKSAAFKAAG